MKEIKAPENFSNASKPWIFLAGSIEMGMAENWQEDVANKFTAINGTILNPRRDNWDLSWKQSKDNPNFRKQVEWELDAFEQADFVICYFSPGTKSPITLLELGLFSKKHQLFVICPEGFWRKGNIDIVCERYGISHWKSLDDVIDEIILLERYGSSNDRMV